MPSPLNPGTDVKSINMPAALLEISHYLQAKELSIPEETRPNNISITYDAENNTATVTMTLPIAFTLDSSGKPVATATDYIPG